MATVASRYPYQIRPEPGLAFILPLIAMLTREPKCCNQMRFESIQFSKMRLRSGLRPDPAGELTAIPIDPMGALQGRPSAHPKFCLGIRVGGLPCSTPMGSI